MRSAIFFLVGFVLVGLNGLGQETPELDLDRFREWGHEEWKTFVLRDPLGGRDFAREKLDVLLVEDRDVVNIAYALGLAEYLMGRHLTSNDWYSFALKQPALRERVAPVWSDEEAALRKESALYNNIGINFEIMGDLVSAEDAYARSRAIDLQLGETDAAWLTAINIGLLRFRENQLDEARRLLAGAVNHFTQRGDALNRGRALLNLASAEQDHEGGDLALSHVQEAFEVFEALGDSTEAVRSLITWGQFVNAQGKTDALANVLREIDRMHPLRLSPQVEYARLVLEASLARQRMDRKGLEAGLEALEVLSRRFPDLPRSDAELEVRMAAAHAAGDEAGLIALFREHSQTLRDQFGNKSAALLAEAWEINDREAQLHQNEQLQLKLRFAQRLNWVGGLTLLLGLLALGMFVWKRQSDLRNQLVIVRLLRRHLVARPKAQAVEAGRAQPESERSNHRDAQQLGSPADLFKELFSALEDLVTKESIHRTPSITLGDIASKLNSNAKYVSQAIRQETSMSYPEYVNMLRIQDAQELMLAEENQGLSLDQIADQSGFGTRRTFYRQFTKFTGMPPGQFLKLSQADRAAYIARSQT